MVSRCGTGSEPGLGAVPSVLMSQGSSRLRGMTSPGDLFAAALTLPESERAELAHRLIVSLDEPSDDPAVVAEEWTAEVGRRLAGIEAGTTTGIPWAEVREQLRS
jgi:putative addiction module component (TIGR02574 family)